MLEEKINTSVLGVIPYFHLDIEDEDSLTERFRKRADQVLQKSRLYVFPGFLIYGYSSAWSSGWTRRVLCVKHFSIWRSWCCDHPGKQKYDQRSLWMRQNGLEGKILRHAAKGGIVFGICGGYQMLGQSISDPTGAEQKERFAGWDFCRWRQCLNRKKKDKSFRKVCQSRRSACRNERCMLWRVWDPYGENGFVQGDCSACLYGRGRRTAAGRSAERSCIWLLYAWDFRYVWNGQNIFGGSFKKKGIDPSKITVRDRNAYKEEQYDRLASIVRENLNMEAVYKIIEKGNEASCSLLSE